MTSSGAWYVGVCLLNCEVYRLCYLLVNVLKDGPCDFSCGYSSREGIVLKKCALLVLLLLIWQVWYHSCPSRGKNCNNTRLKSDGGCTIWYNEKQVLGNLTSVTNTNARIF